MTNKQYANMIRQGHFIYWDMLGRLRGLENHKESDLQWLTGNINYNYFTGTSDAMAVIERMRNNEIPKNLVLLADSMEENPAEPFLATGLFKEGSGCTGMAHELLDTILPEPDKRINLFRVHETSQLKAAGAILNTVFEYRFFSFDHFAEMMENDGQFFYLAEYDGIPAGACMSQHGDNFVAISWAGTLPGYRKLGIAGHLIQLAERDGITHGKTAGVLEGRPDAVGSYRRIGYREYCRSIDLELV